MVLLRLLRRCQQKQHDELASTVFRKNQLEIKKVNVSENLDIDFLFLHHSEMFKTISRKKGEAGSDNSDSGSDHEQQDLELDDGDEFAGFGSDDEDEDLDSDDEEEDDDEDDDDDNEQEQSLLNNGEDAPYGEEELPENLPSLQDAITTPVFELSKDAAGRKTVHNLFAWFLAGLAKSSVSYLAYLHSMSRQDTSRGHDERYTFEEQGEQP